MESWSAIAQDERAKREPSPLNGATVSPAPEPESERRFLVQAGNNDWHSPPEIVCLARKLMGGIDLDPASCAEANLIIEADKIYTGDENDDGLKEPWWGRVWLNPPYSYLAPKFITRFCNMYREKKISQGCLLLGSHHINTAWFDQVAALDPGPIICMFTKRLKFGNSTTHPTHGSMLVGVGVDVREFCRLFSPHGTTWQQSYNWYRKRSHL
jgi:ParB family chromosome partitioning protein